MKTSQHNTIQHYAMECNATHQPRSKQAVRPPVRAQAWCVAVKKEVENEEEVRGFRPASSEMYSIEDFFYTHTTYLLLLVEHDALLLFVPLTNFLRIRFLTTIHRVLGCAPVSHTIHLKLGRIHLLTLVVRVRLAR